MQNLHIFKSIYGKTHVGKPMFTADAIGVTFLLLVLSAMVAILNGLDSYDPFYDGVKPKPKPTRSKPMTVSALIYKSDRFVVFGNIGLRVTITDRIADKCYVIQYSDLVKFRRHFEAIKREKKDSFIILTIAPKVGREISKEDRVA